MTAMILSLIVCTSALLLGCKALHHMCREDRFSERAARNNAGSGP